MNKYKNKILVISVMAIFIALFAFATLKNKWTVDDVYGKWKITRLISASGGTRTTTYYGSHIGRSFAITPEEVFDSNTYFSRSQNGFENRSYAMDILHIDESVNDVSEGKSIVEFQIKNNIILSHSDITDDYIVQYDFYPAKQEDDELIRPGFTLYSYDYENQDKLMMFLEPGGYYLLERFKKQEKIANIYGTWVVEYLVSRGISEQEEIGYINKYGKCFEIGENFLSENNNPEIPLRWEKQKSDRNQFEYENGIQEGLGIENEEIEIWYAKTQQGLAITVIPINDREMIISLDGQWFLLKRIPIYNQRVGNIEQVLCGTWKIQQLLAMGEVNEELETEALKRNDDYISWWYGQVIYCDHSLYEEEVINEDWKIEIYDPEVFFKKFSVPENIVGFLKNNDSITVATRTISDVQEIFIVLDKETMIRGRNGLWFKIKNCRR